MAVVQKGVDECAVAMTSGWVNDQPGRLVYDDEMLVFENNIECNVLRAIALSGTGAGMFNSNVCPDIFLLPASAKTWPLIRKAASEMSA